MRVNSCRNLWRISRPEGCGCPYIFASFIFSLRAYIRCNNQLNHTHIFPNTDIVYWNLQTIVYVQGWSFSYPPFTLRPRSMSFLGSNGKLDWNPTWSKQRIMFKRLWLLGLIFWLSLWGRPIGSVLDHDGCNLIAMGLVSLNDYVIHIVVFENQIDTCPLMVSLGVWTEIVQSDNTCLVSSICFSYLHSTTRCFHYIMCPLCVTLELPTPHSNTMFLVEFASTYKLRM